MFAIRTVCDRLFYPENEFIIICWNSFSNFFRDIYYAVHIFTSGILPSNKTRNLLLSRCHSHLLKFYLLLYTNFTESVYMCKDNEVKHMTEQIFESFSFHERK